MVFLGLEVTHLALQSLDSLQLLSKLVGHFLLLLLLQRVNLLELPLHGFPLLLEQ